MPRKLIIHIGSHKTGTSSIQHVLMQNKNALLEQGYSLFHQELDGSERAVGNAIPWIKGAYSRKYRITGKISKKLPAKLIAAGGKVIVSAEAFSWVFEKPELEYFHRVLMYVRAPLPFAKSWYNQVTKGDNPYGRFVDSFLNTNDVFFLPHINAKY